MKLPRPGTNLYTTADCHLAGQPIEINAWSKLESDDLARIVGDQQPAEELEKSEYCTWTTDWVSVTDLLHATQDGDLPEGSWSAAYLRHLASDMQAVANGSPEYAGRDAWIRDVWLPNSRIYPLYLINEFSSRCNTPPRLRLLDGHRRLAGAFHYGARKVFALVGTPRMLAPVA
jgi:hypothetical protein